MSEKRKVAQKAMTELANHLAVTYTGPTFELRMVYRVLDFLMNHNTSHKPKRSHKRIKRNPGRRKS